MARDAPPHPDHSVSNIQNKMKERIIWQYWEARGTTPDHITRLQRLITKNSGVKVVLVTPENVRSYLDDVPEAIFGIKELAHKADMLRTMLVAKYGGMWLDSDALVLKDLNPLFDLLDDHEFVGFNNKGKLGPPPPYVRVNCFLSRPGGRIVSQWVERQHSKLPKTVYSWREVGSEILHPLCQENPDRALILDFETISPVAWNEWEFFFRTDLNAARMAKNCMLLMVNLPKGVGFKDASEDSLLSNLMAAAEEPGRKMPSGRWPFNTRPGFRILRWIGKIRRLSGRVAGRFHG